MYYLVIFTLHISAVQFSILFKIDCKSFDLIVADYILAVWVWVFGWDMINQVWLWQGCALSTISGIQVHRAVVALAGSLFISDFLPWECWVCLGFVRAENRSLEHDIQSSRVPTPPIPSLLSWPSLCPRVKGNTLSQQHSLTFLYSRWWVGGPPSHHRHKPCWVCSLWFSCLWFYLRKIPLSHSTATAPKSTHIPGNISLPKSSSFKLHLLKSLQKKQLSSISTHRHDLLVSSAMFRPCLSFTAGRLSATVLEMHSPIEDSQRLTAEIASTQHSKRGIKAAPLLRPNTWHTEQSLTYAQHVCGCNRKSEGIISFFQ